jgi:hypothetical protein
MRSHVSLWSGDPIALPRGGSPLFEAGSQLPFPLRPAWTSYAGRHGAGVTFNTLSLIERGEANPTWETVRGIAAALDVSIAEIAKLSLKFEP